MAFSNLYDYQTKNGIVIPDTTQVKADWIDTLKAIFGSSFSTDSTTINGRLIEALTILGTECACVTAQNLNSLNITQAVGSQLDKLGAIFGVNRTTNESDAAYRKRIAQSASRGSGFADSIRQAIGNVVANDSTGATIGVENVAVLDNGLEDPNILPKDEEGNAMPHSICVAPHSVLISVKADSSLNSLIGAAIASTKACGCGMSKVADNGTLQEVTRTSGNVYFFSPSRVYANIAVTVLKSAYTGTDIVTDTKNAILDLVNDEPMNATHTKSDIISAIASYGKNIVCTSVAITAGNSSSYLSSVSSLAIQATQYVSLSASDITVTVQ